MFRGLLPGCGGERKAVLWTFRPYMDLPEVVAWDTQWVSKLGLHMVAVSAQGLRVSALYMW